MTIMHTWQIGIKEHSGEIAGRKHGNTSVSTFMGFSFVETLSKGFGLLFLWYLWIGRTGHPGPQSLGVSVELFNVGGWLTHGGFALEAGVDFLAVVEHKLIPARVRSEWASLRRRGLGFIWAPACQDSSCW